MHVSGLKTFLVGSLFMIWCAPLTWAQVERVEELTFPPLPEIQIPEPTRVELDNGMVVLLMEDHELPLISVSATIRTGSRLESKDKIGLAGLVGSVMRSGGTTTMNLYLRKWWNESKT